MTAKNIRKVCPGLVSCQSLYFRIKCHNTKIWNREFNFGFKKKQTNKQTNKQTKTKTKKPNKQNKTKQTKKKTKNRIHSTFFHSTI